MFVSTDGCFTITDDGRAAYLYDVRDKPDVYRKATELEIQLFQLQKAELWALVEKYTPLAYRIAYKFFKYNGDYFASTVGVDAIIDAHRRYKGNTNVASYIRNELRYAYMKASWNNHTVKTWPQIEDIDNDDREYVYNLLSKLPKYERMLLELYFFKGLTYEQIAILRGCTKSTILNHVKHAIALCQSFVKQELE